MKKFFAGAAATAASLTFVTVALAVGPPYCGTYATPAITAPDAGIGADCQATIAKNTQKYLKTLLKVRGACLLEGDYSACPNTDDDAKVQAAAGKAAAAIAAACGDTTGLGSSYDGAAGENVGSCTLSQNHGTAELFIAETHGNGGDPYIDQPAVPNAARVVCQQGIGKAAQKYLPSLVKIVDKCIAGRLKDGITAGLGEACVGSLSGGGLVPPTDEKAAEAIGKATAKMEAALDKACTGLAADQISSLFSCPGATSEGDLDACVECSGLNALFEVISQQYAETGSVVTGNIQTAVNDGSAGDRFLIASGDYSEGVFLPPANCAVTLESCLNDGECPSSVCGPLAAEAGNECAGDGDCTGDTCNAVAGNTCDSDGDNMQFIGCGAATDDRPRIIPPEVLPPTRGFNAAGVDGLLFQGLEVTGWSNDGIFVTDAEGVTFRDCLGNGDDLATEAIDSVSTYAFFPVTSTGVVVEGCEVVNVRDAGIYVGQSVDIVVRHNLVYDNVTGIEIENSEDAVVYGNTAHDNTGGILSFKLSSPVKQTSGGHHFFDNVSYENNTVNFGIPGTTVGAVPQGTGFMIISEDDSIFENNIVEKNWAYGMLILDQEAINILVGPPPLFDPTSPDQDSSNLTFLNNRLPVSASKRNGTPAPEGTLFAGNWTLALNTPANGTCFNPLPTQWFNAPLEAQFEACP